MKVTKSYLKNLVYQVTGAAIEVHKELGPGLLESTYHKCMKEELTIRGLSFSSELKIPIDYKGISVISELRCDLLIENILPVELKSVENIIPVYEAQILTYMKLLNAPQGILINFNCCNIYKEGQRSYVNELYRALAA